MVMFVAISLALLCAVAVAFIVEYFKRQKHQQRTLMQEKIFGRRLMPTKTTSEDVIVPVPVPVPGAVLMTERTVHKDFFEDARSSPFDALACLRHGDIDGARLALQKISYLVHADKNAHPDQVRRFTDLMCKFVHIDPLFWQCFKAIKPVIEKTPGIRQTVLYVHMPVDVDLARYVMYFAHETGHIVRRKRGNSYEVFLPEQEMPEAHTKRSRKKTASGK